MKIKVNKDQLLSAIGVVGNIVSTRATLPILSNMMLEAKEDVLKLNTTDLDIGIACELPVHISEQGAITVWDTQSQNPNLYVVVAIDGTALTKQITPTLRGTLQ